MPLIKSFPHNIYVFELDEIPRDIHNEIYALITKNFYDSVFGYYGGRNICLDYIDSITVKNFVNQLYDIFLMCSQQVFGPFSLLENNSPSGWANLSNGNYYLANIHNHEKTASINGVFYFSMPEDCGGELDFYDSEHQCICTIMPRQNQLLIFPGSLHHKNRYCNSERFRISINIEILCDKNFNKIVC